MRSTNAITIKKLLLVVVLVSQAGCLPSDKIPSESTSDSSTDLERIEDKQIFDKRATEEGQLKSRLHTKMISFLDLLDTNEAFAYLDNNSGKVEPLIMVKHHPEIFIHNDKASYVLCVSTKNIQGDTVPVDVYIKQGIGGELFVYDMRSGEKEREALMTLMKKSIFKRF